MNKYIICAIFLRLAAVEISHEHSDLVLVEYDGEFFLEILFMQKKMLQC